LVQTGTTANTMALVILHIIKKTLKGSGNDLINCVDRNSNPIDLFCDKIGNYDFHEKSTFNENIFDVGNFV